MLVSVNWSRGNDDSRARGEREYSARVMKVKLRSV